MSNDIVINMKKKKKVVDSIFKGTVYEMPKIPKYYSGSNKFLSIHNQTRPLTGNLTKDYSVTAYIKKPLYGQPLYGLEDDTNKPKKKRKRANKTKL